jgi:hypothetical protein
MRMRKTVDTVLRGAIDYDFIAADFRVAARSSSAKSVGSGNTSARKAAALSFSPK